MGSVVLYVKLRLLALFSGIRAKLAGSHCAGFLTKANGVHIIAPLRDVGVGRWLAFHGSYDPEHLKQYLALVNKASRVLVGTHVGSIFLPIGKLVREVVGIEANPEAFQLLNMNIAINSLTKLPGPQLGRFRRRW